MKDIKKLSDFAKNIENPFLDKALEVINKNIVQKNKTATNTGESAILKAIDESTGEVLGHTTFIRQIEVDEEQFAKFYLSNFSAFYDLKPSSIKVFGYILKQLKPNADTFAFYLEDCIIETNYTKVTIYRALTELLINNIIARGRKESIYFINPMVVFNGNRITFARTYVKKQTKKTKAIGKDQLSLPFDKSQANFELDGVKV